MSETYILQKGKFFTSDGERVKVGEAVVLSSTQAEAFKDMFVKESVLKAQSTKDVNLTLEQAKKIIAEDEAKKKAEAEVEAAAEAEAKKKAEAEKAATTTAKPKTNS